MNCPTCDRETRVLETRQSTSGVVRRRRQCRACGARFTTNERIVSQPFRVRKRNGRYERFDRGKLRRALLGATHKRPVSASEIDRIVGRVEAGAGDGELDAARIGELVLAELRELDYGAYLQFAGTMPDLNPEIAASRTVGSVRVGEEGS
jgi:transcriptional repressor NrdR